MGKALVIDPAPWATDPLYSVGPNPWSGGPTRINPGSAALAVGATPNTQAPAQVTNYQLGTVGDTLSVHAQVMSHEALTAWAHATTGLSVPTYIVPIPATSGAGTAALRSKEFVLIGTGGGFAIARSSPDMRSFDIGSTTASFGPFKAIACDDVGNLFGAIAGSGFKQSADLGVTWSNYTPGLSGDAEVAYFTGAKYVVAGIGTTATSTALGSGWAVAAGFWGGLTDTGLQLVGNRVAGSTATILVMLVSNSGTGHVRAVFSTDSADTWSLGHDFGALTANIAFSEAWGSFVVVTSAGQLWTSPDGATWTLQRTAPSFSIGGTKNTLAACGYAIVSVSNRTTGSAVRNSIGVAYTLDLGSTWYETYFGDMTNSFGPLVAIVSANGRLYAIDGSRAYVSGMLETPSSPNYLGS